MKRYLIVVIILASCLKTKAQTSTESKPDYQPLKDIIEKDISWTQDKNTLTSRIPHVKRADKNVVVRICCRPKEKQNYPLYILTSDGKRFQSLESDSLILHSVKPDWIQSIEVLKDANAINKYGLLAKNGVILLDFKRGTLEKMPNDLCERFKSE